MAAMITRHISDLPSPWLEKLWFYNALLFNTKTWILPTWPLISLGIKMIQRYLPQQEVEKKEFCLKMTCSGFYQPLWRTLGNTFALAGRHLRFENVRQRNFRVLLATHGTG